MQEKTHRTIKNFSIYRASAGSGKTYILTYNYIRLALKYQDYFKSILAVTFTNKATEEMKSRILETLEQLAKGDHAMTVDLMKELSIDKSALRSKSDALLKNILHNYSFFAVTTIDAFFQKIVRSFAHEVGIQTGFKIELDSQKVISEVIDKMLTEMGDNPQMVCWLTDFAVYQISQGKSWDTRREIKNLSSELFKEFLLLNKKNVFEQMEMEKPDFMLDFISKLHGSLKDIQDGLLEIGKDMISILEANNLSQDDFAYKATGVGGYISRVSRGEFVEPGKRVYSALEEDKWTSKASNMTHAVDQAKEQGLVEKLSSSIDYYNKHVRDYHTLEQVVKYLYTFGLLSAISKEINTYRDENDLLLISDFSIFLNDIINDSDAPYIYEKVGTRYKHYLIDEFQDTSGLQWNNFKPLVRDALSAGNFSMVVGDIKQSIYRWRGGNWKILLDQIRDDIDQEYINDESLLTNRRSRQNIVEFNNDFFEKAPQILEASLSNRFGGSIDSQLKISSAYDNSSQGLFDKSGEGLIDIQLFDKDQIEDAEDQVFLRLIQILKQLQDANYQLNDIAVLVRTNPQGRKIVSALMQHTLENGDDRYNYDIISNESLYLKNNPAVHLILQGLYFVESPTEPLSVSQLEYAYSHYASRISGESNALVNGVIEEVSNLHKMSMSQVVEFLIHHFEVYAVKADHAYVLAFQDLILDYLKYEKNSIIDFLIWWKDHDTRSVQVSEDQNAIRLMTVHKSKGLQFKAVIIPYCNWKLDHSGLNEQLIWCDTQKAPKLNAVPFVPLRYKTDMQNTDFSEEYFTEKSDIYLDNLNLLYVALTRAEEALFITCPLSKSKTGEVGDVAQVLLDYAKAKKHLEGQVDGIYHVELGKLPEYDDSTYVKESTIQVSLDINVGEFLPDRTNLRYESVLLDNERMDSINYGDIVHWIFSKIRTKEDFNSAIDRAEMKFGINIDEMSEIKKKLREVWDIPKISGWFDSGWQVKNEASILLTNGKTKRPDRVLVRDDQVVIIDYKTGNKSSSHQNQIMEYKNILSNMGYAHVEGYLIYMTNPELVSV